MNMKAIFAVEKKGSNPVQAWFLFLGIILISLPLSC